MGGDASVRVAIVGAGAVSQDGYLPACESVSNVEVTHVVDVDESRARSVADEFGVPEFSTDHREVLDDIDAAIVTTPPEFHAAIARDCFERDVHVLTEKPIATSPDEAAEVVAEAERRGLHYAVSRPRRHLPCLYLLKQFVDAQFLGELHRFEVAEGRELDWEFRSGYRFDADRSWGGVLSDMGPHMLDVLQWYFGDAATVDDYDDDGLGGVEGNAELSLTFDGPRSVSGTAAFSHTRQLDNRVILSGKRGRLEASLGHPDHDQSVESVRFHPARNEGDRIAVTFENATNCSTDWLTRLRLQIGAFADAVGGGEARYAPAESGLLVVDLIDECYGRRDVTPHSWERERAAELTADGGDGSA